VLDVEYRGKTFKCALWMAKQAEHFEVQLPKLLEDGVQLIVHGEGLLSWIANARAMNTLISHAEKEMARQ